MTGWNNPSGFIDLLTDYELLDAPSGQYYFWGGPSSTGAFSDTITQTVNLTSFTESIDANMASFFLSAQLGSQWSTRGFQDFVFLSASFSDSFGQILLSLPEIQDPASPGDEVPDLIFDLVSTSGTVPPGARLATVVLRFSRLAGFSSDSFADDIQFCLG